MFIYISLYIAYFTREEHSVQIVAIHKQNFLEDFLIEKGLAGGGYKIKLQIRLNV